MRFDRTQQSSRCRLPFVGAVLALTGWAAAQPVTPGTLLRDFDRDGAEEELISRPGVNEIQRWNPTSQTWAKADYALPEGVWLVDDAGKDAGLRFVDLNGDGFDDVLFSNPQSYAIHLWTKDVKPDLGWTRGWSQFVRAGARTGAANEPPSLVGAAVRIENGELIITRPAGDGKPATVERRSLKELIAFDMPPPKSPAEALASFRVRPGFRIELVAAEPAVIDPIAFEWGADGRLWVVEMRDYPLGLDGKGKPGGVVKVLEGTDGDGRCDKVTTFLEGVAFPSSVMPWRKGALIAAAPDLFYAEDTDGDGRADVRKVLFTGFNPGNQQHRFNGFEWGLDGWIYAANGDSGGTVKSLATGKTISISGRDIRFRPDTGEIETVSAQTQFGRRRDDWGNWFGNNNPTWLWHVTLPEHYLRRNPKLAVRRVLHVLANYEDSTRVFPASTAMVRPNQPWSLNHVTSGCSPCPYRDDLFGPEFATSVFAGEPVHNVVHREVLVRAGAGFTSHRAAGEEQSEFLASTDNWFRPITIKTGPDGALYVADMYRFVLEHPEWISPEMQARLDLRAGADKGRIYRIVPEGKTRRPIPNLAAKSTRDLAAAMDSVNGWQRDTAQRLLVERTDAVANEPLNQLLTVTHAPQVRLQALATLGVLGALTPEKILAVLADPHPAVRCEALRQSETLAGKSAFSTLSTEPKLADDSETLPHPGPLPLGEGESLAGLGSQGRRRLQDDRRKDPDARRLFPLPAGEGQGEGESLSVQSTRGASGTVLPAFWSKNREGVALFTAVAALASDSDAAVRLQTAFSLGEWSPDKIEPVLRQLAARDDADELLRIAIMSSLRPASALFTQLKADAPIPKPVAASVVLTPSSSDRAQVIAGYAGVEKLVGDALRGQGHFQTLCTPCHRLRGEGNEVGADLGMVGAKPVDWLLTAILDPSQAVEARYRAWTITLKSGDVLDGIISTETANNLVLRVAGGIEHAVLRSDIAAMSPLKLSLMPTGFESALKPQDLADLLRWLRGP